MSEAKTAKAQVAEAASAAVAVGMSPTGHKTLCRHVQEEEIEIMLSDRLVEGCVLMDKSCPACVTPLLKQMDEVEPDISGENSLKKGRSRESSKSNQSLTPIDGVPFCVGCQAHVVTSTDEIDKVEEQKESLRDLVLTALALEDEPLFVSTKTPANRELLKSTDDDIEEQGYEVIQPDQWRTDHSVRSRISKASSSKRSKNSFKSMGTTKSQKERMQRLNLEFVDDGDVEIVRSHSSFSDKPKSLVSQTSQKFGGSDKQSEVEEFATDPVQTEQRQDESVKTEAETAEVKESFDQEEIAGQQEAEKRMAIATDLVDKTPEGGNCNGFSQSDSFAEINVKKLSSADHEELTADCLTVNESEDEWLTYEEKKAIAAKALGVKMMQGYALLEKQCHECSMPMTEFKGDIDCVVCPALEKKTVKVKHQRDRCERERVRVMLETQLLQQRKLAHDKKNRFFEKTRHLSQISAHLGIASAPANLDISDHPDTPQVLPSEADEKSLKHAPTCQTGVTTVLESGRIEVDADEPGGKSSASGTGDRSVVNKSEASQKGSSQGTSLDEEVQSGIYTMEDRSIKKADAEAVPAKVATALDVETKSLPAKTPRSAQSTNSTSSAAAKTAKSTGVVENERKEKQETKDLVCISTRPPQSPKPEDSVPICKSGPAKRWSDRCRPVRPVMGIVKVTPQPSSQPRGRSVSMTRSAEHHQNTGMSVRSDKPQPYNEQPQDKFDVEHSKNSSKNSNKTSVSESHRSRQRSRNADNEKKSPSVAVEADEQPKNAENEEEKSPPVPVEADRSHDDSTKVSSLHSDSTISTKSRTFRKKVPSTRLSAKERNVESIAENRVMVEVDKPPSETGLRSSRALKTVAADEKAVVPAHEPEETTEKPTSPKSTKTQVSKSSRSSTASPLQETMCAKSEESKHFEGKNSASKTWNPPEAALLKETVSSESVNSKTSESKTWHSPKVALFKETASPESAKSKISESKSWNSPKVTLGKETVPSTKSAKSKTSKTKSWHSPKESMLKETVSSKSVKSQNSEEKTAASKSWHSPKAALLKETVSSKSVKSQHSQEKIAASKSWHSPNASMLKETVSTKSAKSQYSKEKTSPAEETVCEETAKLVSSDEKTLASKSSYSSKAPPLETVSIQSNLSPEAVPSEEVQSSQMSLHSGGQVKTPTSEGPTSTEEKENADKSANGDVDGDSTTSSPVESTEMEEMEIVDQSPQNGSGAPHPKTEIIPDNASTEGAGGVTQKSVTSDSEVSRRKDLESLRAESRALSPQNGSGAPHPKTEVIPENASSEGAGGGTQKSVSSDSEVSHRKHWESLRAESRAFLARRCIVGWKLLPDTCKGNECGDIQLVAKGGAKECVICGGTGTGTDGVYALLPDTFHATGAEQLGSTSFLDGSTKEPQLEPPTGEEQFNIHASNRGIEGISIAKANPNPQALSPTIMSLRSSDASLQTSGSISQLHRDFESKRSAVSQEIAVRMSQGWTLLNLTCPQCVMPLMSDEQGQQEVCLLCGVVGVVSNNEGDRTSDGISVATAMTDVSSAKSKDSTTLVPTDDEGSFRSRFVNSTAVKDNALNEVGEYSRASSSAQSDIRDRIARSTTTMQGRRRTPRGDPPASQGYNAAHQRQQLEVEDSRMQWIPNLKEPVENDTKGPDPEESYHSSTSRSCDGGDPEESDCEVNEAVEKEYDDPVIVVVEDDASEDSSESHAGKYTSGKSDRVMDTRQAGSQENDNDGSEIFAVALPKTFNIGEGHAVTDLINAAKSSDSDMIGVDGQASPSIGSASYRLPSPGMTEASLPHMSPGSQRSRRPSPGSSQQTRPWGNSNHMKRRPSIPKQPPAGPAIHRQGSFGSTGSARRRVTPESPAGRLRSARLATTYSKGSANARSRASPSGSPILQTSPAPSPKQPTRVGGTEYASVMSSASSDSSGLVLQVPVDKPAASMTSGSGSPDFLVCDGPLDEITDVASIISGNTRSVTSEAIDHLLARIEDTQVELVAAEKEEDGIHKQERLKELLERLSVAAATIQELDNSS